MSAFDEKKLQEMFQEEERIWQEILQKAEQVDESDVHTMLYCRENDSMYFNEEDFWEDYSENSDDFDELPTQLWVTQETSISSVKNADFDLNFDGSARVFGEKVYIPAYKQYVLIDWEAYEEWNED